MFSCTVGDFVAVRELKIGDQIRSRRKDGTSVCSDVYFVYKHPALSRALSIEVEDGGVIQLSYNHLVYVRDSSRDQKTTRRAKHLQPGDYLVTSIDTSTKIVSIESTTVDLVNVLTIEPALELSTEEGAVMVSAHSHHETLYSYLFWPVRLAYQCLGPAFVKGLLPIFELLNF